VSIAVLATAIVTLSGSVFAQSVDQVLQAELRRLNLAQQSQERINNIVEGTRSLEDQYRAINKEIDGLRVYNRLMMAQTEGQKAVLEDISLSMDQVDVINRQIFPLMERMIDGLEQSVALDVPFLMEERSARIDNLKEIMERSDVSVAEKFRKVMEAFQIEMDFGSTIEPYKQSLTLEDGTTRDYNMLRIGRVLPVRGHQHHRPVGQRVPSVGDGQQRAQRGSQGPAHRQSVDCTGADPGPG
jgi:hypothetical protein